MKKLLLFMFAAFAFAACEQTPIEEQSSVLQDAPETLTVGFEGDETRIQLNEAQKTVWTKGDLVSVFYRSNANQQWKYDGATGARTATLKRVDAGTATRDMDRVVVVYPYNEDYYINPSTFNVQASLPATQTYLPNSYGLDGNIMISSAEYNDVTLKNVCGWLKLQLTGDGEVVKSITFKGNNGEQVAGELYINSAEATAILASDMGNIAEDDGNNATGGAGANLSFDDVVLKEVTLDCGSGVTLGAEATAFYIALPPQTFEKGFKVEIVCVDDTKMVKSSNKALSIERNHIQPMAAMELTPSEPVNLTLELFDCQYYGTEFSDSYNYYIMLSDLGTNEEGYLYAGGTYYYMDLYSVEGNVDEEGYIHIPAGTYKFDANDTTAEWTMGNYYSEYLKVNAAGTDYEARSNYEAGEAVVTENGITLTVTISGVQHTVTYNGAPKLYVDVSGGGEGGGSYSTLTGDWNCNLSAHTLYYAYYGDWYEVGYQNWVITIMPNSQEGDFVQFDLLAGTSETSFAGEYTISDSLGTYTAYPGYIDAGYVSGAWYYKEDGVTMAPFVDGWVDVVDNGNGTYTVEFDVWDDCDYNLTGKWTGEIHPASELQSVTRSSSMKHLKSIVVNEAAPVAKERIVAKSVKKTSVATPAKGLKLL